MLSSLLTDVMGGEFGERLWLLRIFYFASIYVGISNEYSGPHLLLFDLASFVVYFSLPVLFTHATATIIVDVCVKFGIQKDAASCFARYTSSVSLRLI